MIAESIGIASLGIGIGIGIAKWNRPELYPVTRHIKLEMHNGVHMNSNVIEDSVSNPPTAMKFDRHRRHFQAISQPYTYISRL